MPVRQRQGRPGWRMVGIDRRRLLEIGQRPAGRSRLPGFLQFQALANQIGRALIGEPQRQTFAKYIGRRRPGAQRDNAGQRAAPGGPALQERNGSCIPRSADRHTLGP